MRAQLLYDNLMYEPQTSHGVVNEFNAIINELLSVGIQWQNIYSPEQDEKDIKRLGGIVRPASL